MNIKKIVSYSSRTADKFVVRMPNGMRDRIAEVARNQHRSMNSEIIARLESSLHQDDVLIQHDVEFIDSPNLSPQEFKLLHYFRLLTQHQQNALLTLITSNPEKKSPAQ